MGVFGGIGGERGVDGRKWAWQVSLAVSVSGRGTVTPGSDGRVSVMVSVCTTRARFVSSSG